MASAGGKSGASPSGGALHHPEEVHLAEITQLTRGVGENAEAYFSHDGRRLTFQSKRAPYQCDQIMTIPADGSAAAELRTGFAHDYPTSVYSERVARACGALDHHPSTEGASTNGGALDTEGVKGGHHAQTP